jgi:ferredoxin-NADP reductase
MIMNKAQEINLVVQAITQEADGVIGLTLADADGQDLPVWTPGAHIGLLFDGRLERQYSLCSEPEDRRQWRIAVLREPESRGGSEWVHSRLQLGDILPSTGPGNQFELVDADRYVFVAGGIGITPLLPMIRAVEARGAEWGLLYGGRHRSSMAFVAALEAYGDRVRIQPEDQWGLLDLKAVLGTPQAGVAIYSCGPERLLEAVEVTCSGWPDGALHVERFRARPGALEGQSGSFEVVLAKSNLSCHVRESQTIIDALDTAGFHVPRSCGEGTCGTCLTKVLEGVPDHRDSFLMGKKRAANQTICVCCSRSLTPRLVLDL